MFDIWFQDTGVKPAHLAIDKPSYKFSQFLKKHYNLRAEIPQVNNFVVFEGFFNDRPGIELSGSLLGTCSKAMLQKLLVYSSSYMQYKLIHDHKKVQVNDNMDCFYRAL